MNTYKVVIYDGDMNEIPLRVLWSCEGEEKAHRKIGRLP